MPTRTIRHRLALALLAASAALAGGCDVLPATSPSASSAATIERVVDGDTVRVRRGDETITVRLLGVDSPESSALRYGRPDCGGRAASAGLKRLARPGQRVRVITDPRSGDTVDQFGRTLSYLDLGGQDLGEGQLAAGMAIVYRYQRRRFSRLARYQAAQDRARTCRSGVWTACGGDFHSARR